MADQNRPAASIDRLSDRALAESQLRADEIAHLLGLARQAAKLGGLELKRHFGKLLNIREKGRAGDLITEADHAAEAAVLTYLEAQTPDFGILAEESGWRPKPSDFEWCVDPLDGTTNYAHTFPFFGTSVGLTWKGLPLIGALAVPALSELFWAAPGMGSWCNGQRLSVSSCSQLAEALLVTGFAYDRIGRLDNNYAEFAYFSHRTQGVRRVGAAAVDLAYVAAGRLDGYWERGLSPWDLAAGTVLVEQAGGVVTSYDGTALDLASGRLIASGVSLHPALVEGLAACQPLSGASYGAPELDP